MGLGYQVEPNIYISILVLNILLHLRFVLYLNFIYCLKILIET